MVHFAHFQVKVKSFFPSWGHTQKYSEVAMFASELLKDPLPVGCHLNEGLDHTTYEPTGKHRADAFYHEAGLAVPKNLFHNHWINHYNHRDDKNAKRSRDLTPVHIPSERYVFDRMTQYVGCSIEYEKQKQRYGECSITITSPNKLIAKSLLSTIQHIGQFQTVNDLEVANFRCDDVEEFDVFNISKNAHFISLHYCSLPPVVLHHFIQQINHCNTINKISLIQIDLRSVSSLILTNKLALTHLHLRRPKMSAEMIKHVCHQITHLSQLEHVGLSQINLSPIDLNLRNMTKLRRLALSDIRMSREQYIDILRQMNSLPYLCYIEMSSNNLTRCLSSFLPDPHPGLPELEWIDLKNTSLQTEDLLHLSNIIKLNKLPKLFYLDLSCNTLTGYLSNLLPDSHQGFPKLRFLKLNSTTLNKEDLRYLANIIRTGKLPRLETIDLDCTLHNIQDELGLLSNFLETCVNWHKTGLAIYLKEINLPAQFRKEMVELCAGTLVHLIFEESESTKEMSTDQEKTLNQVSSGCCFWVILVTILYTFIFS